MNARCPGPRPVEVDGAPAMGGGQAVVVMSCMAGLDSSGFETALAGEDEMAIGDQHEMFQSWHECLYDGKVVGDMVIAPVEREVVLAEGADDPVQVFLWSRGSIRLFVRDRYGSGQHGCQVREATRVETGIARGRFRRCGVRKLGNDVLIMQVTLDQFGE